MKRDISNREQLVLCVRWVSDHYEVFEDQIGLIQLENTTAETIYSSLKDCLLRLGIPLILTNAEAKHMMEPEIFKATCS